MRHKYVVRLLVALAFTVFCTVLFLLPGDDLPKVDTFNGFDKLVHCLLFAGLGMFWLRLPHRSIAATLAWLFLYGLLIELVQYAAIPGRSGEWQDLLVDGAGLLLAALVLPYARRWLPHTMGPL